MLLKGQTVKYRGTQTGMRISAVDGTAFIDNLPYTYSSDFSAGTNEWAFSATAGSGNIDSIGGEDDTLRVTTNNSSSVHYTYKGSSFTVNKTYKITFRYYIPSGQSNIDGIKFTSFGASTIYSVTDTWTTVSVSGKAIQTELVLFATDGGVTSFQDAGGDDVFYIKDFTISEITPYIDGNHSIEIYDSAGRMLKGVLKAAGSSETLGADILSGAGAFASSSGWNLTNGFSIADGIMTAVSGTGWTASYGAGALNIDGGLYQSSIDCISTTPNDFTTILSMAITLFPTVLTVGTIISYATQDSTDNSVGLAKFNLTGAGTFDNLVIKQVTAPSSSGATIVSAKAGETYNWAYKNSSFTYNASSYFCVIKTIR
jgi:hypothetical protein